MGGLDSQFAGLSQWRKDVEEESRREKGNLEVLPDRANRSHIEAKGDVGQLKQELGEMRDKKTSG